MMTSPEAESTIAIRGSEAIHGTTLGVGARNANLEAPEQEEVEGDRVARALHAGAAHDMVCMDSGYKIG